MRRMRFDFSYLVSAAALLAGAVTVLTGFIADVWDLNQFTIHSYAGYLAAGVGILCEPPRRPARFTQSKPMQ